MSILLGPDGKEMEAATPVARRAPSRQEKFNMVYMMFTLMSAEERRILIKTLRPLRRELDVKYPLGMTEADIQRDIEKQVNSMENEAKSDVKVNSTGDEINATVPSVPEQENHAEPVNPEVATVQDVHSEQENGTGSAEGSTVSAS